MKRLLIILSVFLGITANAVHAEPSLIPAPPELAASSYILMDAYTGDILVSHNADEKLPPASLTKLMTAYITEYELARGDISVDDKVTISEKAWRMKGSRTFVREGTRVPLMTLMQGMIVQSGNDATVAIAEHIAGSESAFADLMNQHAKLLGMKDSHFVNATGYPADDHYSSAHDIAIVARATITQFPENYPIYAEKYFTYNNIRQPNRNRLLWRDKSVDGLKTGHTEAAGFCLAASAVRNGTRLITVVMGTKSDEARASESQKLLDYGFRYYETRKLYSRGQVVNNARVWGGSQNTVKVGFTDDVLVTLPRQDADSLPASLQMNPEIEAPIKVGDVLGKVVVGTAGNVVLERNVVALEPVEQGGFFKRIFDKIKLFFMNLF
ncbi:MULTISPECIES: D-alanyl-D-alanine carboxypeptidase family protein [Marinomonas]|jgi:D-alanyl-D-alanine carboxypeptidase (penicillin-binding protein 5/6)|uniref:D-alanyl-D-alanine carboxypeptidase family protein n=1 Tax=Marinomonas TaxID=28253 RepID=UPI0010543911|nr:D-alanyl-D-alanine carboxypeptidase family protein [Marinomonas sp. KMM3893]